MCITAQNLSCLTIVGQPHTVTWNFLETPPKFVVPEKGGGMKRTTAPAQRRILFLLCVFFLVGFVSIAAYSQNSEGTILGHVQDSSGAAVAGANVIHQFTINSSGDYVFVNLIPGTYQVTVARDGFKTEVTGNLILEVDQT